MRTRFNAIPCLMTSLLAGALPAAAQTRHAPSFQESLSLRTLSAPQISPDGRFVAYLQRATDWKENEFVQQIWLVNVSSGKRFQLTQGRKGADQLEWSPDSRWLAFASERESQASEPVAAAKGKDDPKPGKPAKRQIWLISPEGGEAWPLTQSESAVRDFHWSGNSACIAFTAEAPEAKPEKDQKEHFSDYQVYEKDFHQTQLWKVDAAKAAGSGLPVAAEPILADPALSVDAFHWSPDSTRIAFSATRNPLAAFAGEESIYLLDLAAGGPARKIVALAGPNSAPLFSPDGKSLAFATALGNPRFYYSNTHLAMVALDKVAQAPATRPQEVRDLTAAFDENAHPVEWGPDGIWFSAQEKTSRHLFRVDPGSGRIQRISAPDALQMFSPSFTANFKTVAFSADDPAHMAEIYVSGTGAFAPKKLTDQTAQVKDWQLGTAEMISWKSQDGTTIEGVLRKPADFQTGRKYPLLVVIHGGPTGTSSANLGATEYAYPVQAFLAKGALVLEPNYRGSAGYGEAFRALNVRNLGVGDMWDVMSGVDFLIGKGLVDPARLGSMGWSQGGYISAFLTTHTDRFKAISVGAGISNWVTYYVSTDITPFTRQYLQATPWDDPEIYARTSPMTTIKQARTPTLIQQGGEDHRVPVPNSYELFRGLQDQGVESRMVLYPGFGHGIRKPKSQQALLQSNLDWFGHYLWNEAIPANSPVHGTSELEAAKNGL
jgi:dipeptidyl aminopeptidase/acylaminoacyl peptidase